MANTFGLPRYVVTFLRHMESHKDYLKWNICESSHKITLTLTWNFRLSKSPSDNLLEKLQRTLNLGRSPNSDLSEATVPPDLSRFLQSTPKSHRKTHLKQRLSLTVGAIRRTLSTGSSHASPSRHDNINRSSSFNALPHMGNHSSRLSRHNSFHAYSSGYRTPDRYTPHMYSPTRSAYSVVEGTYSRASSIHNSQSADELDYSTYSTPHTDFTPSSICGSESSRSPRKPRRLKLTYRSEDELQESLENIMEKTRSETQSKLQQIRQEWNQTIRDWPKIVTAESTYGRHYVKPPPSLASTYLGAPSTSEDMFNDGDVSQISGEDATSQLNSPDSPDTIKSLAVVKCLDSCEKILNRYETEI